MITYANDEMVPHLKTIWKEAFGDSDATIDFYFNRRYKAENTLVYLVHGMPVSMLTLLPSQMVVDGALRKVDYVYAVATLSAYRQRGLSTALLRYANTHLRDGVWTTFLTPATPSLFEFYYKQGYHDAFAVKEIELAYVDLAKAAKVPANAMTPERYKAIRDAHFYADGYVCWDLDSIAYIIAENALLGGRALEILDRFLMIYCIRDNKIVVKETTLPHAMLPSAVKTVMEAEGLFTASVRLHPNHAAGGAAKPFALTFKPPRVQNSYFNLASD